MTPEQRKEVERLGENGGSICRPAQQVRGDKMNKYTVMTFSQDPTGEMPQLIDCLEQEPPVLIRSYTIGQDELLQYWGTDCKRMIHPYDSQIETPWYQFTKAHGFEIRNRLSTGVFNKQILCRDLVPRNVYGASFVRFFGYLGENQFLCLEAENKGIVCKELGGNDLWETKEKYANASYLSVSIHGPNIYIHNTNEHILTVYTVDGRFVCTLKVPDNFLDKDDGDSKFYFRDGAYFAEGFFDGHRLRGKKRLYGRAKLSADRSSVEHLFKIDLSKPIIMCRKTDDTFLYAGYGSKQMRQGDTCWSLSLTPTGYVLKDLVFVPQPDQCIGGATIMWLDKDHFLYWNDSRKNTKLYYCNLQGDMDQIADGLGMFDEEMVAFFNGQLYILHGLLDKNWDTKTYQLDILDLPT